MKAEQSKKEIEIPVEASSDPESNMKEKEGYKIKSEIDAEASTDQDSKNKALETPTETSTDQDCNMKEKEEYKIKSEIAAEASSDQDSKNKAEETPAEVSTDQGSKKKALETPSKASTDQDFNVKSAEMPTKASTDQHSNMKEEEEYKIKSDIAANAFSDQDSKKKAEETPAEASTDQDSKKALETSTEVSTDQDFNAKSAEMPTKASTDQDSNKKAVETPTEASTDLDSDKKVIETPVQACTDQDSTIKAAKTLVEASINQDSYKKATESLVEASTNQDSEGKAAETPAGASTDEDSYKKATAALVEASTNQDLEKKAVETPAVASIYQDSYKKAAEIFVEASTNRDSEEKAVETPAKASTDQDFDKKAEEALVEASTDQDSKKRAAETPSEAFMRLESSRKITPKSLKSKTRIAKKSNSCHFVSTSKEKHGSQAQLEQEMKKHRAFKGDKRTSNNEERLKLKSREGRGKNIINGECRDENRHPQKDREKIIRPGKRKRGEEDKRKCSKLDSSMKYHRNRENRDGIEKGKTKEKLGGLIFMCSAKTKPDCFHYRVMGVSLSKKELVMGVKPGLTIFLYDFDLKLLYGLYKASSYGGMKLEPRAFGGAFPVQVRFSIKKDCLPLPENVFRKAIKENYNRRHKFKTELTMKQVKKLTDLFRPIDVHSTTRPILSPQVPRVKSIEVHERSRKKWPHSRMETIDRDSFTNDPSVSYPRVQHTEVHERLREAWPHSRMETLDRNTFTNNPSVSDPLLSRERDHLRTAPKDMRTIQREETPRDLYLTEEEYRARGLPGERRNLNPSSHLAPNSETYWTDYEMLHLRQPDPTYRSAVSTQRETIQADPVYLNEKEYQAYGLVARHKLPSESLIAASTSATALSSHAKDPYHSYGAPSGETYEPNLRRHEVSSGSYSIGRKYPKETAYLCQSEGDEGDGLYFKYAANTSSPYKQIQHYHGTLSEAATGSISSLQSESHQVELLHSTDAAKAPSYYNQIQHYHGTQPEAASGSSLLRYSYGRPSSSRR